MNKIISKPDRLHFTFVEDQDFPPAQKLIFHTAGKAFIFYTTLCLYRTYLFYGLEQVLFVWSVGWDAAMATKLERGHEYTHGILLVFG